MLPHCYVQLAASSIERSSFEKISSAPGVQNYFNVDQYIPFSFAQLAHYLPKFI